MPFWTLTNTDKMILVAGEGKKSSSPPFNFKKSDNTVLQFHDSNEVSITQCSNCYNSVCCITFHVAGDCEWYIKIILLLKCSSLEELSKE